MSKPLPDAIAAQMFRTEVLKDRYTVLDGTSHWYEKREGTWHPISQQTVRNLVNQYCMTQAMKDAENQERWEPFLYASRQRSLLQLAGLSEQVRKPREFYGFQVPMDEFFGEVLVPVANGAVTQRGLYRKYQEFAADRLHPQLGTQTFKKQLTSSEHFKKFRMRSGRLYTEEHGHLIDWLDDDVRVIRPWVYFGVNYKQEIE